MQKISLLNNLKILTLTALFLCLVGCATKPPPSLPERHLNMLRSETLFLVLKNYKNNPDIVDAFVDADKYLKRGLWKQAEAKYKQIIRNYPFGQQTYFSRFWVAMCYEHQHKNDIALKMYQSLKNSDTLLGREARRRIRLLE